MCNFEQAINICDISVLNWTSGKFMNSYICFATYILLRRNNNKTDFLKPSSTLFPFPIPHPHYIFYIILPLYIVSFFLSFESIKKKKKLNVILSQKSFSFSFFHFFIYFFPSFFLSVQWLFWNTWGLERCIIFTNTNPYF